MRKGSTIDDGKVQLEGCLSHICPALSLTVQSMAQLYRYRIKLLLSMFRDAWISYLQRNVCSWAGKSDSPVLKTKVMKG
jgi:hypothetical protein